MIQQIPISKLFFFASAITEFDLLDWLEIEMQNETEQIQVA